MSNNKELNNFRKRVGASKHSPWIAPHKTRHIQSYQENVLLGKKT